MEILAELCDSYKASLGAFIVHFAAEVPFCEPIPPIAPSGKLQWSPSGAGPSPPSSLLSLPGSGLSILRLPLFRARSLSNPPVRINDQPCEAETESAT